MISPLDEFYLQQPEPLKGCMLFLRQWFLKNDCTEAFNYNTPFFRFKGKPFCYLIIKKDKRSMYVGFMKGRSLQHEKLFSDGRKVVKLFYIDPEKEVPLKDLKAIVASAKKLYAE